MSCGYAQTDQSLDCWQRPVGMLCCIYAHFSCWCHIFYIFIIHVHFYTYLLFPLWWHCTWFFKNYMYIKTNIYVLNPYPASVFSWNCHLLIVSAAYILILSLLPLSWKQTLWALVILGSSLFRVHIDCNIECQSTSTGDKVDDICREWREMDTVPL